MDATILYRERATQALKDLNISPGISARYAQILHSECEDLVSIGLDMFGREQRLEPRAAAQWAAMAATAGREGIVLSVISCFRSFDYQRGIIERKLAEGQKIEEIVRASALPGFSEHHTGRAIDIGTPGSPPLEEEFGQTAAFKWLAAKAGNYGFFMSFPRGNTTGIMYEPWHWLWRV